MHNGRAQCDTLHVSQNLYISIAISDPLENIVAHMVMSCYCGSWHFHFDRIFSSSVFYYYFQHAKWIRYDANVIQMNVGNKDIQGHAHFTRFELQINKLSIHRKYWTELSSCHLYT